MKRRLHRNRYYRRRRMLAQLRDARAVRRHGAFLFRAGTGVVAFVAVGMTLAVLTLSAFGR